MKNLFAIALICATTVGLSGIASAASSEAKMAYTSANDAAAAQYKTARAQCDSITGNPKDVCIAQAKAARIHTEADAKALYKNTLSARTSARKSIAEADYAVDKAKCGSQDGNAKDVVVVK
jgi:outer membrane lipoprotein-sorting protein